MAKYGPRWNSALAAVGSYGRYGLVFGSFLILLTLQFRSGYRESTLRYSNQDACNCPATSPGWTAYPDSAHYIPEVLKAEHVSIRAALACEHGLHFFIQGRGNGRSEGWLSVDNPARDQPPLGDTGHLIMTSSVAQTIEPSQGNSREAFEACLASTQRVLGCRFDTQRFVSFDSSGWRDRPRLLTTPPMRLRFQNRETVIAGRIDLYTQAGK